MFSYGSKRAVVTGAGRGIGAAVARAFAHGGADLVLVARSEDELRVVAREIERLGRAAHVIACDVCEIAAADDLLAAATAALGGVDVLVNNAGGWPDVEGAVGALLDATPAAFDAVYRLNVQAPLFPALAAGRTMIEQGCGGAPSRWTSRPIVSPSSPRSLARTASLTGCGVCTATPRRCRCRTDASMRC